MNLFATIQGHGSMWMISQQVVDPGWVGVDKMERTYDAFSNLHINIGVTSKS